MDYFQIKKKWFFLDTRDYKFITGFIFIDTSYVTDISMNLPDALHLYPDVTIQTGFDIEGTMVNVPIISFGLETIQTQTNQKAEVTIQLGNYQYIDMELFIPNDCDISELEMSVGQAIYYAIGIVVSRHYIDIQYEVGTAQYLSGALNYEFDLSLSAEMELQFISKTYVDLNPIYMNSRYEYSLGLDYQQAFNIVASVAVSEHKNINATLNINCYQVLKFRDLQELSFYQLSMYDEFKELRFKLW